MTKQMFTVISTSGWQGDFWHYHRQFSNRKAALEYAAEIKSPHSESISYITAVIGDVKVDGYNYRGDTRRTGMKERHLCSRDCYIADDLVG